MRKQRERHKGVLIILAATCLGLLQIPASAAEKISLPPRRTSEKLPIEKFPIEMRDKVREVVESPTITGIGPGEIFTGSPELYTWLLDHPDRALVAWQRLGAIATEIKCHQDGSYSWKDGHGSLVHWRTICNERELRVWYAEGSVRPAPLLPLIPVRAVLVMRHADQGKSKGRSYLVHQTEVFVITDSRAAAVAAKALGGSVARFTEQGLHQLEFFFSGLVWYLDQHPERLAKLFQEEQRVTRRESSSH